jgi:EAL domain-containing protein (putative c-di-GMP-specific phosphodiesterase class I)
MLETHGLPADRLTLEIAESSVVADDARTLPGLRQLSALGVRVAVDGFGNGHSSLTYLRRMPIRQVKIDAGFVSRIDHDLSDEAIVRSIVDLGAKLGLDVVAEGVDRQAVWEQLRRMGCGHAQGALLARPLRLSAFADWLRADDASPRRLLGNRRVSLGGPRAALEVDACDPLRGQAS